MKRSISVNDFLVPVTANLPLVTKTLFQSGALSFAEAAHIMEVGREEERARELYHLLLDRPYALPDLLTALKRSSNGAAADALADAYRRQLSSSPPH